MLGQPTRRPPGFEKFGLDALSSSSSSSPTTTQPGVVSRGDGVAVSGSLLPARHPKRPDAARPLNLWSVLSCRSPRPQPLSGRAYAQSRVRCPGRLQVALAGQVREEGAVVGVQLGRFERVVEPEVCGLGVGKVEVPRPRLGVVGQGNHLTLDWSPLG